MISDDMKEELKGLTDECLIAIIGYCGGLLDSRDKTVKITIRGGCLEDVEGLPPGYNYELTDWDNKEAEGK